jgi:hypothetical protein
MRRLQGNAIVLAVLRSPAHRLLSGMAVELRYTGRRSGRQFVLPVQYARAGDRLVVVPQAPESATWWRNFAKPAPVQVRLRRRWYEAVAHVVRPDDPRWEPDRQVYEARWRRLGGRVRGPLVSVTIRGPVTP